MKYKRFVFGPFYKLLRWRPVPRLTKETDEERARCTVCGAEHEQVRPGKTQPTCDCELICPDCGEKTIEFHTEEDVKDSEHPNVSGWFCSKCGPFPEEDNDIASHPLSSWGFQPVAKESTDGD